MKDKIVKNTTPIKLFKAPCNITNNNTIEIIYLYNKKLPYECICVRYKCGKIKWKKKGYKKRK